MTEKWKDIEGFEGLYQVSNLGRVKCLKHTCPGRYKGKLRTVKEHIMANTENKANGYIYVSLSNLDRGRTFSVHRLVAKAFLPNPDNKTIINHKDENKHNNCVTNLEWCTSHYNNTYNNVHLKRKHYVHAYEYDLNKIKALEEKLCQLKVEFVEKYPSIKLNEIKMQHKEIRHEITKTRLKAIEALRTKDVNTLRECMRRLQELDHKLYDE